MIVLPLVEPSLSLIPCSLQQNVIPRKQNAHTYSTIEVVKRTLATLSKRKHTDSINLDGKIQNKILSWKPIIIIKLPDQRIRPHFININDD